LIPTPANSPLGLTELALLLSPERQAQTRAHRSWAPSRAASYERLEFLGDVVLELVVTAELLARNPDASEGDLAWMRQQIVARDACAAVARDLNLPRAFVAAAPSRHRAAAREMAEQVSVRAALVEALIGACWSDLGHERTAPAVLAAFSDVMAAATLGRRDAKTALQELVARDRLDVRYELVEREGPPHARIFTSRVLVGGDEAGRGSGTSKQASEQAAAQDALNARTSEAAPC
jgi:ribonuclease-3